MEGELMSIVLGLVASTPYLVSPSFSSVIDG